jgi:hypothetical protein
MHTYERNGVHLEQCDSCRGIFLDFGELSLAAITDVGAQVNWLGSLTLGAALPIASGGTGTSSTTFVNLATNVTGTLPVANGGTGVTISTGSNAVVLNTSPTIASPDLTGTPTAPTASAGTNTTQVATTAFVQAALQALHPVGSVYINATNNANPGTLLGFGTWTAFGAGRVPVGFDSTNTLFDTAEEIGGSANAVVVSHTHTATVTDPGHSHTQFAENFPLSGGGAPLMARGSAGAGGATSTATTGITVANSTEGVTGTDANYQPYITVYMWKRTA